MLKLAVIAFPGNNCEIETRRAAQRSGFEAEIIRWNEIEKIGQFDAYILPGGFSFEDRGKSGVIASREPIFDALRKEAKKGKVILGICNGAQMVVESGLIPVGENALPFALAHNMRRDQTGHVLGTGFYNEWCHLTVERADTAFTNKVVKTLHIPFAHGEGRFTTVDPIAETALKEGSHVAFRYTDSEGKSDEHFPITPNGAMAATAAIVNKEGTIMAIMPHPERFFENFDGSLIFDSMKAWIEAQKSPKEVAIGDFTKLESPEILELSKNPENIYLEKKLIITDNENFSIKSAISGMMGVAIELEKTILFEVIGDAITEEECINSGLFFNANKEFLVNTEDKADSKFFIKSLQDDTASHLAEHLSKVLGKTIKINIYKAWDFKKTNKALVTEVLQNRILCNPNAEQLFKA